jgi:ankyrin repeat protein
MRCDRRLRALGKDPFLIAEWLKKHRPSTALLYAAKLDTPDVARLILLYRGQTNVVDVKGYTPLHVACVFDRDAVADLFLRICPYDYTMLFSVNYALSTPLHVACFCGSVACVALILERSRMPQENKYIPLTSLLSAVDVRGRTPLHVACAVNNTKVIETIVGAVCNGSSPLSPTRYWIDLLTEFDGEGYTCLHYASQNGNLTILRLIALSAEGISVSNLFSLAINYSGQSLLHVAGGACNEEAESTVHFLAMTDEHIKNLLFPARVRCVPGCIWPPLSVHKSHILNAVASLSYRLNAEDIHGRSPLHHACMRDYHATLQVMLSMARDMYLKVHENQLLPSSSEEDENSSTSSNDSSDDEYVSNNVYVVDVNAKNVFGFSPVHEAAIHGSTNAMRVLVDFGNAVKMEFPASVVRTSFHLNVDLNAKDYCGMTPLHMAVQHDRGDVIDVMLSFGTSVNVNPFCSEDGMTPLDIAKKRGNCEIVRKLEEVGGV